MLELLGIESFTSLSYFGKSSRTYHFSIATSLLCKGVKVKLHYRFFLFVEILLTFANTAKIFLKKCPILHRKYVKQSYFGIQQGNQKCTLGLK